MKQKIRASMRNRLASVLALLAVGTAAACTVEDAVVQPPTGTPGGELFARYVAVGNSITAGMQSAGLSDSLQQLAYPVLLARQAGAPFRYPALNNPGCPRPYAQPVLLGSGRVGGPNAPDCSLRATPVPDVVQNLGLPGETLASAFDLGVDLNPPEVNFLKTFILGGRTQIEAMVASQPTLISVWLGNNEQIGPAARGDAALLTSPTQFAAALDQLVTAIGSTPARDVVMIGPVNGLTIPAIQPGAYYWALAQSTPLPKPVSDNCAPGTPGGANLLHIGVLSNPQIPAVSCAADAPLVITPAEQAAFAENAEALNAAIRQRAEQNGWIYIDPRALLNQLLADPNQVRKCQGLATATPATFMAAVQNTCPGPTAPNFFGAAFSFDATHPSTALHRSVANLLIQQINQAHGLQIPTL
jgi:hypothetical protein